MSERVENLINKLVDVIRSEEGDFDEGVNVNVFKCMFGDYGNYYENGCMGYLYNDQIKELLLECGWDESYLENEIDNFYGFMCGVTDMACNKYIREVHERIGHNAFERLIKKYER